MPFEGLQDAVDRLQRYIEMPSNATIPATVLAPQTGNTSQKQVNVGTEVVRLLLNISRGSKTTKGIAEDMKKLSGDDAVVKAKIRPFVDGNPLTPADTISSIVGSAAPRLSLIQSNTVRVTPAGRLVDATAMFLNMIPTLEMSRAVPYLTVDVQTKRPPISVDGKAQGLSLMRFLQGALDVSTSKGDQNLLLALQTDFDGENKNDGTTTSGMEMFLSPQTLVDPDPSIDGRRSAPVIDKFRPFMSIEKLTVEVQPQVGFFSYRTANLELTLHDRSRLNEIADFIRPDLYGSTELMIEYGWSHPDKTDENAYALLLNAMRVREKYGIVNSSFSFTKSGEVKIKLRLFTKGFTDMQTVTIGDDFKEVKAARQALEELQRVVTEVRIRVLQEDTSKSTKEVRGEQQLFAHAEDLGATLELSKDAAAAVKKFLQNNNKSLTGDMQTLHDALVDLYGPSGNGGQKVSAIKKKISDNIKTKLKGIKDPPKKSDPFLDDAVKELTKIAGSAKDLSDIKIAAKGYVSLGRLMAIFVGQPLANNNDRYEDVQLIFYPFNAKAAAASNLNIASFPIKVDELIKGFTAIGVQQGLSIPIKDFMQYIANNFIDDMSSHAYGLGKNYQSVIDEKTGVRRPPQNAKDADDTALFDALQRRLKKLKVQDGTFKMPQLDVIIETVPLDVSVAGQSAKTESKKTVLKIHFFDRCATAYESLGQMILASRENTISALGNLDTKGDDVEHIAVYNNYLNLASQAGIITPVDGVTQAKDIKVFDVKFDYERLKTFIRQNMPSITYGVNNTNIEDANFATIQEPKLATIHMRRSGEQGGLTPAGLTKANLPLRTLPAQVSMSTAGCPLIHYMQQFFIDFGTNTTCDNIYGVNKLSHELVPGKFSSKIDFVPLDAYGQYQTLSTQVGVTIQKLEQAINKSKKK